MNFNDDKRITPQKIRANELIGNVDVLFITLDTLRFDVAEYAMANNLTPNLQRLIPLGWEQRHTPGSFTYAAHQAFFAGFLPTPVTQGPHGRLFAAQFAGSESTTDNTCVFETADIVTGLAGRGYHTICVGGVGFFNKQTPLGNVLPGLFAESFWTPALGVTDRQSTQNQVEVAINAIDRLPTDQRAFAFVNISAIHQPNHYYFDGTDEDSAQTQAAALAYVDSQLPPLFSRLQQRAPVLCIVCSDHGTAYGEDGYSGHRLGHPVVWDVPYAEFVLPQQTTKHPGQHPTHSKQETA